MKAGNRGSTPLILTALLTVSTATTAAIIEVGPSGDFTTLQAAIDASLATTEVDEIRIVAETFTEQLGIFPLDHPRTLTITGGWASDFSTVTGRTTLSGGGVNNVFEVDLSAGDSVTLENLIVADGAADNDAGLSGNVADATLRVTQSEFRSNVASSDRADGGAIRISASGTADVRVTQVTVADNQVLCSGNVDCRNAGIALLGSDAVYLEVSGSVIERNRVEITTGSAFSAGVSLSGFGGGTLVFNDNVVRDNEVVGTNNGAIGVRLLGDFRITARRNQIVRNTAVSDVAFLFQQMATGANGDALVVVENTLIADGNGKGLIANVNDGGTSPAVHLMNLTIANNADNGLQAFNNSPTGVLTLTNSITSGNGTDRQTGGDIQETTNLSGLNIGFVNAAAGNYQLSPSSPAVDAGTLPTPVPISSGDAAGGTRLAGAAIDIGAFELGGDVLFTSSFEAGE
ncbi:MAG: choice-of-anchor Q domain-containing protein [Pseudomonadota bacterium]